MSTAEREAQLIALVQQGDTAAFAGLVAPHRRKLLLHIMRVVSNPTDADDVFQETLFKAYCGLTGFRGESGFFTWIYRIAMNCALRHVARKGRLAQNEADSEPATQGWDVRELEDPETVFIGKQLAATVDAALDAMLPEYKTAIVLREFEGLSYHEIAHAMVCPVGTVKSRISVARAMLASTLKKRGFAHAEG